MRLSLCMIVRDEEADLARCLASARGAVDEIVVLDTGSRDRSAAIAREHGARVASFAWCDDFAAARNASLALAGGDWILVLDADEELPAATRAALGPTLAATMAQGLTVTMRNLSPPGELVAFEDAPVTRLFARRAEHRFEGRIHEQVAPSITRAGGRVEPSGLLVIHHGYARAHAQGGGSRAARNLALLEQLVRAHPGDAYAWFQLGSTKQALGADADAVDAFQRALALDPRGEQLAPNTRATLFAKLAQLALAGREPALAAQLAEACLALEPGRALALQLLGLALLEQGEVAGGRAELEALLACEELAASVRGDVAKLLASLPRSP
jgi:predicted Zn-dependent protease